MTLNKQKLPKKKKKKNDQQTKIKPGFPGSTTHSGG